MGNYVVDSIEQTWLLRLQDDVILYLSTINDRFNLRTVDASGWLWKWNYKSNKFDQYAFLFILSFLFS